MHVARSGLVISVRMQAVMKPPHAKKNKDVLKEVVKWQDERAELRALGACEWVSSNDLPAIRNFERC